MNFNRTPGKLPSGNVLTFIFFTALGFTAALSVSAQEYRITDLGTLGGAESEAEALNERRQIAGRADTGDGSSRAFLYDGAPMMNLGTLEGGSSSHARGVNENGQVVGDSGINAYGPQHPEDTQAFLWQQGEMRALGALHCPCSFNDRHGTSFAGGINDFGQVVGWSETVRGSWVHHAFLWENGSMRDIGGGAGNWSISRAYAVNNSTQVVGFFAENAGRQGGGGFDRRAFLWRDGVRQDLGTLPGHGSSVALDISDSCNVVGWSGEADGSVSRAVIWQNNMIRELGALDGDSHSGALAVNGTAEVVGWSGSAQGSGARAVLWRNGDVVDLNDTLTNGSGWTLTEARAINDAGDIVGVGLRNGRARAFLLEPVSDSGGSDDSDDAEDSGDSGGSLLNLPSHEELLDTATSLL